MALLGLGAAVLAGAPGLSVVPGVLAARVCVRLVFAFGIRGWHASR